ncbi:MAG: hypothetical protein KatS3mg068_2712 [Candidatus Sericytochromatia bacterium]|nr:MAG: hypothetical protein KatS3mg068_2712 [Candidatus Sericytochromatia bacterium]GIX40715.1 MAG: hypothetical protein KatS3mg129_0448 [Leptospiraceae bacterium]
MKTIFFRLFIIITLFYILILFLFYVLTIKKNLLYLEDFIFFFIISFLFYLFTIYLLYRTSNYIVKPITLILNYFKKFPKYDKNIEISSKIIEIQLLHNFTQKFLKKYSSYLEELNLEKSLLNSLLNNLKEGVICLDQNGKILYINQFIKNRFCYDNIKTDFKEKNYFEVIKNPALLDLIYKILYKKNIQYIFSGLKQDKNVFEIIDKDKFYHIRFYEIHLEPFNEELQKMNQDKLILFIINDMTEEYNIKRMREDFLQNASHELKTPITSIRGYTETLLDRFYNNHQNKIFVQFLEGILRNSERMERIINDMVMISSLESKSYPFHPTEININEFLDNLRLLVEGILKPKNLCLQYKIPDNIPTLYADPLLLEHMFINLISNAARYSTENQTIEIQIERINGGKISISIKDYGPGIPDEYKNKIFERFFRIDKDRSRKEGGTGLGLSIVRQIVRIHQGHIFVKDNPEGGSIFIIHLPI